MVKSQIVENQTLDNTAAMDSQDLGVIQYEVFYNRQKQIMEEGKEVLRCLSGSTIAREAGEVMQAFYLPTGEATSIATGILMHIMNVTRVIKYMKETAYELNGINVFEGDQFVNNDAYIGGMHVPDISLVAPIFYKGELVGYTASISHTTEVGGIDPGGMCPGATEAWHDGIILPAVKLVEKGQMRRDVLNMILRAVRAPAAMEVDLKARLAANERVQTRMTALIDDVGIEFFKKASRQLLRDAEKEARDRIQQLRPGIYCSRVYNDTVGIRGDRLATIEVKMEVTEAGELHVRVPVVSPQLPSYNNAYLPAVEASAFYVLLVQLLYDTRWNSAIANLVHIEVLPHSRLNADASQSVGYATVGISQVFTNALVECMSRAFYCSGKQADTVAMHNAVACGIWGGVDQYGRSCGNILSNLWPASGMGGRFGRDGIDSSVQYFNPWTYTADAEGEEALMPVLHWAVKHRANSGGFGRWRGGNGVQGIDVVHRSDTVVNYVIGTGGKIPVSQGLFGGYPAASVYADRFVNTDFFARLKQGNSVPVDFHEIRGVLKGDYIEGPPSISAMPVKAGDIVMYSSLGGAGQGDPLQREPAAIEKDLQDELVSVSVAEKMYKVSIDHNTLKVNLSKTKELREQERQKRKQQGEPCGIYLKTLVKKRRDGNISEEARAFLDETRGFCNEFAAEMATEEMASKQEWKPVGYGDNVSGEVAPLTMYVGLGKLNGGQMVTYCTECGFIYGGASHNFKYYSLAYERDPREIYPGPESGDRMSPDPDWCVLREFYCPGCGTQIEVEAVPPGTPILQNYVLAKA
ncbi:MAG: hydantoinase B/oxoprolinase family protein [Betaproteobacteria bacterium]|nr:hydantoinase B/oxoprolinase family protein [Betaproteobacteria bacterium]